MRPTKKSANTTKTTPPKSTEPLRQSANTVSRYEEIFLQMAENIQEIFWMLDAATFETIYVSPAFETICGIPCQNLYDAPVSYREIIHADDRAKVLAHLQELPQTGRFEEEFRIVRPDGELRWILCRGFLVRNAEGEVYRIAGVAQDITVRKNAQESLKRSEADYRSLFECAPYGIFRVTLDGRFLLVNSSLVRMLGYGSEDDLLGANASIHVFTDPSDCERTLRECSTKERFRNAELRWKRRDGAPLRVLASGRFVQADHRGAPYCEFMVEDITERRALENQVLQSQKMDAIALLAGGTSHDFNTLLTGMLGYAELLLMSPQLDDSDRRKVEAIVAAAVQARAITRQLLTLGRKQELKTTIVNVSALIADLEDFLRRMAGPKNKLLTDLRWDVDGVNADATQLTQVVMNLVANARDAMPQGGRLTIQTSAFSMATGTPDFPGIEPGQYLILAITDTGCGMDDRTQSRIFEPFFTTKPEGKGTGLGLAMVHGIVEQSGGHIRVSTQPGAGTTFRILLPCTKGAPRDVAFPRSQCKNVGGCETILVVDDYDVARNLTLSFLSAHGYTVLTAKNGREAIRIAKIHHGPIHLLVTDIVMPKMSGTELARRFTAVHPETKVIYMTAYAEVMDVVRLGLEDQHEVISKPYMHHELMGKVRDVLGRMITH
jgi:two-component system, cell cycle sensor histidine kinase and response regulator CckA